MNKTKIEWVKNQDGTQGYTINPVKGLCPMGCSYCYAHKMYKRFHWNPEISYISEWWQPLRKLKAGKKIFIGSTIELFHDSLPDYYLEKIFKWVRVFNDLTFIFLTKCPQNLIKWEFPDNCWVGVSATDNDMAWAGACYLRYIEAKIKFISFEPLLKPMHSDDGRLDFTRSIAEQLDWVIIGSCTPYSKKTAPQISWIKEIVDAADKAGIPVFLKDNLEPLWTLENRVEPFFRFSRPSPGATEIGRLRQELPR